MPVHDNTPAPPVRQVLHGLPAGVEVWRLALRLAHPPHAADWALLGDEEAARARRYRRLDDQVRAVATRAALRRLLAARTGGTAQGLQFDQGPHGKPWLPAAPGLGFNVSHAGEVALIAFSSMGEVGVDIERADALADHDALGLQLLSPAEQAAGGLGLPERWVVKEAVLKALGWGIGEHLQNVSVLGREGPGASRYRLQLAGAQWPHMSAWALVAPAGCVAALALVGQAGGP